MADDDFVSFVLDQLSGLPGIRHRRMFGAAGLYCDDVFFAIVDDGRLYLRTDDGSRPEYESRGMQAFQATPDQVLKNYYEVPVDVLEDDRRLCEWARRAVTAQKTRNTRRKRSK